MEAEHAGLLFMWLKPVHQDVHLGLLQQQRCDIQEVMSKYSCTFKQALR